MNAVSYFLALKSARVQLSRINFDRVSRVQLGPVQGWSPVGSLPGPRQGNVTLPSLSWPLCHNTANLNSHSPALTSLLSVNVKGRRKVTFVLLLPTSHTSLCPPSQAGSPIIESNNECCCLDYRYPMFWQLSMTHESFLLLTSFETCSISGI